MKSLYHIFPRGPSVIIQLMRRRWYQIYFQYEIQSIKLQFFTIKLSYIRQFTGQLNKFDMHMKLHNYVHIYVIGCCAVVPHQPKINSTFDRSNKLDVLFIHFQIMNDLIIESPSGVSGNYILSIKQNVNAIIVCQSIEMVKRHIFMLGPMVTDV